MLCLPYFSLFFLNLSYFLLESEPVQLFEHLPVLSTTLTSSSQCTPQETTFSCGNLAGRRGLLWYAWTTWRLRVSSMSGQRGTGRLCC